MKTLMPFLLIVGMLGCGGDPNEKANELFVESVQLINSAENKTGDAAIADYEQALANVQRIIDEYSESDLAVKLVSGETLFSDASLSDIRARLGELHEEKEAKRMRSGRVAAELLDRDEWDNAKISVSPAKPVTIQDESSLTLTGHSSSVASVSFSPDGKRIVSGSCDKTLKVWDLSSLDTSK